MTTSPNSPGRATLSITNHDGGTEASVEWAHTLVVGSGAAGLCAAVRLRAEGVNDLLIVTEGLDMGTSINAGSDKQTYYKLSLCGGNADSPRAMAETYFAGGAMHGDLAMAEAAGSARAFLHLVDMGVPFPTDEFGQYPGYKTDHDPRQRATSVGPYTSRDMCRALIRKVRELDIDVRERNCVIKLITMPEDGNNRACGVLTLDDAGAMHVYMAENIIFAVGGPGGLYATSVYPTVHTGAIGIALLEGAAASNLPESQYGLASTRFRWNVSGTYMQSLPRVVSTAADGRSDENEFLLDYFADAAECYSNLFLKGYQWPFDSRKAIDGSSIIDILVYVETVERKRRVFLDYRTDPSGLRLSDLSTEAADYLENSGALLSTPIARLAEMNSPAIDLYAANGIDLRVDPLEVAVCAQHNNGGLAADKWWHSVNIPHLFPVGEVNGSHGLYRPGGSALNAGQVGAFRAAEYIANRFRITSLDRDKALSAARTAVDLAADWKELCRTSNNDGDTVRRELQERMSRAGAHVRSATDARAAEQEAWEQWQRISVEGCGYSGDSGAAGAFTTRQLCFAHAVYLSAIAFSLTSGVGSRGSALSLHTDGRVMHPRLGNRWKMAEEDVSFRDRILCSTGTDHQWIDRRQIPDPDAWFENAWRRYRDGKIYDDNNAAPGKGTM